jgi:hypothetical protein
MGRKEGNGVGKPGEQRTSREIGGKRLEERRVTGRKEGNGAGQPVRGKWKGKAWEQRGIMGRCRGKPG